MCEKIMIDLLQKEGQNPMSGGSIISSAGVMMGSIKLILVILQELK